MTLGITLPLIFKFEYTGSKRGLKTGSSFWTNSSGSFVDAWDETYGYDANLDYLTSFTTGDGQSNASQSWTYDAAGNRASDYTGSSWAYDNLNRMTSNGAGTSYSNDILGNRTGMGGSTTYSWDALNRMTGFANSSVTESYVYRADGMRVSKSASGASTLYRYDGQMGIEDVDTAGSSSTTVEYGLGPRGIEYLAATNGSGTLVSFPIYDAHGNMVATLARSGSSYSIANQRDFDLWGNIRGGATAGDPKGRYCANLGHKQDDESSLIYMKARYCDPSAGRFLSEDKAMDGMNWFAYCGSDPANLVDSSGNGLSTGCSIALFFLGFLINVAYNLLTGSTLLKASAWGLLNSITTAVAIAGAIKHYPPALAALRAAWNTMKTVFKSMLESLQQEPDPAESGVAGAAIASVLVYAGALMFMICCDIDDDDGP